MSINGINKCMLTGKKGTVEEYTCEAELRGGKKASIVYKMDTEDEEKYSARYMGEFSGSTLFCSTAWDAMNRPNVEKLEKLRGELEVAQKKLAEVQDSSDANGRNTKPMLADKIYKLHRQIDELMEKTDGICIVAGGGIVTPDESIREAAVNAYHEMFKNDCEALKKLSESGLKEVSGAGPIMDLSFKSGEVTFYRRNGKVDLRIGKESHIYFGKEAEKIEIMLTEIRQKAGKL